MLTTVIVLSGILVPVVPPALGTDAWIGEVLAATKQGHWRIVAALGMIGLVYLVRSYGSKLWKPLASGKYAVLVTVVTSVLTELGMVWYAQGIGAMGVTSAVSGTLTGLAATGIYRGAQTLTQKR